MLSEKYRKYIDSCFKKLSTEEKSVLNKSAHYCAAQWICYYNRSTEVTNEDFTRIIATKDFRMMLRRICNNGFTKLEFDVLFGLCNLIRKANFTDGRAKLFYQYYLTNVVADTSLFTDNDLSTKDNGPVSCTMIHFTLLYAENKAGSEDIFDCIPTEVFTQWKDTIRSFGVEYDEFERYWNKVHWLDAYYNTRKRQKIENAAKEYAKQNVPLYGLLEHYAQTQQFSPENLRRVSNPWEHVTKKQRGFAPERGMTMDEKLFNEAAYQISREQPTDVIQTVFYKGRDDGKIECAIVNSEVRRLMADTKQCLVVNPSPAFLKELSVLRESTKAVNPAITLVVHDELIAGLYRKQFPEYETVALEEIARLRMGFDHVVILARDHETAPLWQALAVCEEKAYITMLIPQSVITTKDPLFTHYMRENNIFIDWILDVPQILTASQPRKKMLLTGRKGSAYAGRYINLHSALTNERGDCLTLSKNLITVPPDWLYRGMTLAQMRKEAMDADSQHSKTKRESLVYDFSAEIKIRYYVIRKGGQIDRARAYYRNIHRPEVEKQRTKGKRPNKIKTERGIRGSTEEEILCKLEKVALYDEYYDHIVADILDYYSSDYRTLTVKTVWFCCRRELQTRISYDETIALQMFCGKDKSLSDLVCGVSQPEDFAVALESIYGPGGAGKREWLQLHLIYQVALEEDLVAQNPLSSVIHVVKEHEQKRIYMLNAALRKNHFTDTEEQRMVAYLCESVPLPGRKGGTAPRYVVESKWLAGAFSLFAGIPVREMCPLVWRDLCHIDDMDEMQLAITKHLNSSGEVISNVNYGNKEHFRKVAVDIVLGHMLMERKRYLMEHLGYKEESLADLPIMLDEEPSGRGRRKHTRISREYVRKVNKQLLDVAQIPENIVSLLEGDAQFDINLNEQKNDLFAANFRHKAYHICGYTVGELSHHLGNKGPDTFCRHYCDYGNDFLQYAMVRKLYRWTYVYDACNWAKGIRTMAELLECDQEFSTDRFTDGNVHVELELIPEAVTEGKIQIEIECEHGFEGAVIAIGKGGVT